MKPRTKLQKQVVELSSKLPTITDAQVKWSQEHCFLHLGYKCKNEVWCSDCSKMWVVVDEELACNNGSIKCPYCGHKLKINVSRKQKEDEATYMTIVTVIGGFQVIRHISDRTDANQVRQDIDRFILACRQPTPFIIQADGSDYYQQRHSDRYPPVYQRLLEDCITDTTGNKSHKANQYITMIYKMS